MKRICFITIFILYAMVLPVQAFTFSDNFNRADSSVVGNGWNEYMYDSGGFSGVVNNQLKIDNGTNEGIGDNFVYYDLGTTLDSAVVSGVFSTNVTGSTFYIGINATTAEITRGNAYWWYTYGKGYGMGIGHPSFTYYILDKNGRIGNTSVLKTGPCSLVANQRYEFEMLYGNDKSLEVRLWTEGSSRPENPTFFYTPGTIPQFTGTNLAIGVSDEGSLTLDNLLVTTQVVPEASTIFAIAIGFLGFVMVKIKRSF